MANSSVSLGAQPICPVSGGQLRASQSINVDASNAASIFKGSFIKRDNDGCASLAAATEAILGVAVGFEDSTGEPLSYLPLSTAGKILYVPAEDCLVSIKSSGATTEANFGECADISAGTPSTVTGRSGVKLDHSGLGTDSAQLQVLRFDPRVDNDTASSGVDLICKIYEVQGVA